LAKPLASNPCVELATDILLKYASLFLCPFGTSQDTAYSKKGVKITTNVDPLLFLMNVPVNTPHRHSFRNKKPSEFIQARLKWPQFIYSEILDHFISGKAASIKKETLTELLTGFIKCSRNVDHAVDDLRGILSSVTPEKLKGTRCIINPSFYQIHFDNETTPCHADLIIDDMLLEIKTTALLELSKDYLSQLLFYFFWATFQTEENLTVSKVDARNSYSDFTRVINSVGIFYSRYDYLFKVSISDLFISEKALSKARDIFFKEVISDKKLNTEMSRKISTILNAKKYR
jgi:hypothetical protein